MYYVHGTFEFLMHFLEHINHMKNSTYCFLIQKFLELMTKDNWNDTMCDLTNFMATFTFPVGTDVVKIQSDLCKDLKEPTSLINKLLEEMNVKNITKVRMSTCSNMYRIYSPISTSRL